MEDLQRSLPSDEGCKLCTELMHEYLAVLSPEHRFRLKLDWVLAWKGLRNEPLFKMFGKCNLKTFDLKDVSD